MGTVSVCTGCKDFFGSNNNIKTTVNFIGLSDNGSETSTTDKLILTFDKDITDFTTADITIVPSLIKGQLNQTDIGEYELAVSSIDTSRLVTVTIEKKAYIFKPDNKSVMVHYADLVNFNNLTANGEDFKTTTVLTLTFDKDITGLTVMDITITPALIKNTVNRINTGIYELAVSGITSSEQVSVSIGKNGYFFNPSSQITNVYYNPYPVIDIDIGDPSLKLYMNETLLQGKSTNITQGTGTFNVSISPGIYEDIIWYLNGNIAAEGSSKTSIVLSKQIPGTYHITVEAVPADGELNSGSHSFVIK